MVSIQIAISQDFFTAFAGIPRAQQKKVNEFVSKFRANPRAPGINYEKINDAANEQYRSVRIDQDYRGIVYKPEKGSIYLVLWVDKHDDAYDWARRHRCEVNPETGCLQLYESVHLESSSPTRNTTAEAAYSPGVEPLFDCRDRELRRLGVPESRIDDVQSISSVEQLAALKSALPLEAYEALSFLAEGLPLDEVMAEYAVTDIATVDTDDLKAALERTHTQRRFCVVDNELELQAMLEAPLEQWRVFLHPSQRKLVERDWNGPVRVLGGAGTGKTVVAMHRARWLVQHVLKKDERLLFTTFTRNLATDIEANLRKICTADEMKQIEVTNIDAWVYRFLKRENQPAQIAYPGQDRFESCWRFGAQLIPGELGLPESFFREEWERVILPQRISDRRDYFKASRVGRGVALMRRQRAQIWPVFEEVRLQLHQQGLMTIQDAVFVALDLLREGAVVRPYRAAVLDEAQDIGSEALKLVRELVPDGKNDLLIVGDGHQRIYGRKASLSQCGINIRGRGRKLKINYRTTEQIRRFATAVLEGVEVDDLDEGSDPIDGYRSLISGEAPVLMGFSDAESESNWVADEIESLLSEGVRPQDICIVGRTGGQYAGVREVLTTRGIQTHLVTRESADDNQASGVRMATMHRIKGLEYRIVFIVGVRKGVVPLDAAVSATRDPVESRATELNERALLHVAGTRAISGLFVSWFGEKSPFLVD